MFFQHFPPFFRYARVIRYSISPKGKKKEEREKEAKKGRERKEEEGVGEKLLFTPFSGYITVYMYSDMHLLNQIIRTVGCVFHSSNASSSNLLIIIIGKHITVHLVR